MKNERTCVDGSQHESNNVEGRGNRGQRIYGTCKRCGAEIVMDWDADLPWNAWFEWQPPNRKGST